ncbi:unnamed protein product [Ilex paraguariensis]|uniref:Uncharacterized protein n=1 Tax=Ilex paraguariensis TaxID=185542 RepID=A0ABC8UXG8_9AQUA
MQVSIGGQSFSDEIRPDLHKISKKNSSSPASVWGIWALFYQFIKRRGPKRLLGIKMATFRLHLICRSSPEEFELYKEGLDDSDVESS